MLTFNWPPFHSLLKISVPKKMIKVSFGILTLPPMAYPILWILWGALEAPLNIKEGAYFDPMLL